MSIRNLFLASLLASSLASCASTSEPARGEAQMRTQADTQMLAKADRDRTRDPNRKICTPIAQTGSRLQVKYECLTVREREAMAQGASQATERLQNTGCVPGPDHPC